MTSDLSPGLHWTIKRSFIRYVARMGDGQILGGHGLHMSDASTFVFPLDMATADDAGLVGFTGELRLQAHNGALSLRIANPRVQPGEGRASLVVDSIDGAGRPLPLVTCALSEDPSAPGRWTGEDVRLAVEAVDLFGGYYGEGEVFDDFIIIAPGEGTD